MVFLEKLAPSMWNISSYDNLLKWGIYLESHPDFPARSPNEVGFPHLATTGFLLVSFHQTELSHDTWPQVLFWTGTCRSLTDDVGCTLWKVIPQLIHRLLAQLGKSLPVQDQVLMLCAAGVTLSLYLCCMDSRENTDESMWFKVLISVR